MKKLVFLAGIFLAINIQAQQSEKKERPQKPTVEQQMKEFDNLDLSETQKEKIKALYQEREAKFEKERPAPPTDNDSNPPQRKGGNKGNFEQEQQEFDAKIQKILTKDQYTKFQAKHKEGKKNGDKAMQPREEIE